MKPVLMPFTHLPESTARALYALVGPVVVYRPLESRIPDHLAALAAEGVIEVRAPLTGDEPRLKAALAEFTQWAAQNPGRSTAGTGFVGSQQGRVPFFDERTINRLRSEIQHYGSERADAGDREAAFSARLFLAVAEENDRATLHLYDDLKQFKALEKGFLDSLVEGDEAEFSRHGLGSEIWQEDPGASHTEQRLRAWATLAAADPEPPALLVTTSPVVMDALMESRGEALHLEPLATIRMVAESTGQPPRLTDSLAELAGRPTLGADAGEALATLSDEDAGDGTVTVTVVAAAGLPPASVIRRMAPAVVAAPEKKSAQGEVQHTLIVLVQSESKSD